jgi:PKD repeat protein
LGGNLGVLSTSYATGSVVGDEFVGGLVGHNYEGSTVSNSYATGTVSGNRYVGGLVGENLGTLSNSYATGTVNGNRYIGGLVGYNDEGLVSNSYAIGNVSGNTDIGGLVGYDDYGEINYCFYDRNTTGQSDTGKGEPKTTKEMKELLTFYYAGWDIWYSSIDLNNGYPYLYWQGDKTRYAWLINDQPNQPPIANFTYTINGLSVTFNASSSYDPDGYITNWVWFFGDGTGDEYGEIIIHNYSAFDTYEVILGVVDDNGYEDRITKQIIVEPQYKRAFIFGQITNFSSEGDFITFEAVKTRVLAFSPFGLNKYVSGELFTLSKKYLGFINDHYIFTLCKMLI